MAAISNTQGVAEPRLVSRVKDSTRTEPAEDRKHTPERAEPVTVSGPGPAALNEEQVRELADHLQKSIDEAAAHTAHSVGFRFDERIEGFVIEIHDEQGELVKQYPPEIVLNLHQKIAELTGMVVDERT